MIENKTTRYFRGVNDLSLTLHDNVTEKEYNLSIYRSKVAICRNKNISFRVQITGWCDELIQAGVIENHTFTVIEHYTIVKEVLPFSSSKPEEEKKTRYYENVYIDSINYRDDVEGGPTIMEIQLFTKQGE